jgi:nucleotide-binding universal stress UspA family protein
MFTRILIPLDGSPLAEQALDTAADVAQRSGATLLLAHADTPENYVYVEGMPVVDERGDPIPGSHEREYLRRAGERLGKDWRIPVETRVLHEPGASSAEMLAQCIVDSGVDLVVMTTHGRGGLERMWLGSVADQLIRMTSAPVLLLRSDGNRSIVPGMRRVLAPLDGTPRADCILAPAVQMADLFANELALMRVVPVEGQIAVTPFGVPLVQPDYGFERRLDEAQNFLDSTAKTLTPRVGGISTHVAVSGHVANSIIEAAQAVPGTLIAMSTHARHGLERLFLGSVADKVLRGYDGPVLVMQPQE